MLNVPLDVLTALGQLPALMERINQIAEQTASLPGIERSINDVAGDTEALPQLSEDMSSVAGATAPLPDMATSTGVLSEMNDRMGSIEAAMPTLVEVQEHLRTLPE